MMNKCIYVGKYPKIPFCKFSYCNVNIGTSIPTFVGFFKDIGTAICLPSVQILVIFKVTLDL